MTRLVSPSGCTGGGGPRSQSRDGCGCAAAATAVNRKPRVTTEETVAILLSRPNRARRIAFLPTRFGDRARAPASKRPATPRPSFLIGPRQLNCQVVAHCWDPVGHAIV